MAALFFYPKGGFIIDFSYRRKAQCGANNRCRTWGKGKERRISHRKLQRQESSNQTFLIKESTNLESTVVPRAAVLFLILIVKKKM